MSTQAAAPNGNTVNTVNTVNTAPTDVEIPQSEAEIDELRKEIDRLDAEILAAIKRRSEVSQIIGRTRMASGGPRLVHSREMKVLERFNELGQEGHTLAMLLLRLGRGRLGH
ncbi:MULTISPECIES: chorismate mutase [Rhodococcus]|uniref:chorismate mutase n=1 Tax=Rhodococcus TaxID=1827 RepID=UPI001290C1E7|nr:MULTISPECIES: chorismate mutase [Rhodococcus]MDV8006480.1 chorismate mutase [Rhodococcus sp. IEGM 1318]MQP33016.1 chorismate mutase [Rhodococcus erythropolis]